MSKNNYAVKVIEDSGEEINYTVEVVDDLKNSKYKPKRRKLVFCYIFLALFFIAGVGIICNLNKVVNVEAYTTNLNVDIVDTHINAVKLENSKVANKNFQNMLFLILVSIFCISGIICLSVILIKDDGGIRFAKLNALMELESKLGEINDQSFTEESISCKSGCKTKNRNAQFELQNTIMNSITEI